MKPIESLHYAIGLLAFAMAKADGDVQKAERQKFHDIVAAGLRRHSQDFDISGIIFQIMDKEKNSTEQTYAWAMHQIRLNSHYLSPEMKHTYIHVMERVAQAFPPVTTEEKSLLEKFREEISAIHGDPTYFSSKV